MFHVPDPSASRLDSYQSEQTSKPLKGAYYQPFRGLLCIRVRVRVPGSLGWAGGRDEQASKQAPPLNGPWFFVLRPTIIVLEPRAIERGTTDKRRATTDHGLPAPVPGQMCTDKRHIFWDYSPRGT